MKNMQASPLRAAIGTASVLLSLWSQSAAAGPLQLLSDARSVESSGTATTDVIHFFYDGQPTTVTQEVASKALAPVVHPADSFGSFDRSDGLTLRTSAATLDGQGFQQSVVNSNGVQFTGVADVLAVSDFTSIDQGTYLEESIGTVNGSAGSRLLVRFKLEQRWSASLTMASNLGDFQQAGFNFQLTSDNGFGWYDPFLIDAQGNQLFSFSTALDLAPGVYTLEAGLSANASASYSQSRAQRVTASFSLAAAPVPEPASGLLILGGLLAMAPLARATRASEAVKAGSASTKH